MGSERHIRGAGGAQRKRFRSATATWLGYVWLVFVAANLVDLALRGSGGEAVVIAAVLLLTTAIVYVTCLRPRIVADEDGVTVHNPLRDVRVPWSAVDRVDAAEAVRLHVGDRRFLCWAVQTPGRARARARLREQARAARYGAPTPGTDTGHPAGHNRADQIALELDAMAQRYRDRPSSETTSVAWSPYALGALGGTLAVVVVSLLVT